MNKQTLIWIIISILTISIVSAVGAGQYANDSTQCISGIGRIVTSAQGNIQCVLANESLILPSTLSQTQDSTEDILTWEPISEAVLAAQISEANTNTDWTLPSDIYWPKRFEGDSELGIKGMKGWNSLVKKYIIALYTMILEIIKLIFYILELVIVIYILFTLVPETFFKLRDSLVLTYVRRYAQ